MNTLLRQVVFWFRHFYKPLNETDGSDKKNPLESLYLFKLMLSNIERNDKYQV